jgi:hypothetical protein
MITTLNEFRMHMNENSDVQNATLGMEDFYFIQKHQKDGWKIDQDGNDFVITNDRYKNRRLVFTLSGAQDYPYAFELKSTGDATYDKTRPGHQNYYTIEKSRTTNIESVFDNMIRRQMWR